MGGFRDKLNRMMYGRYGNDQLNKAILILTIICLVISMFTRIQAFYMIALAGLLLAYYRMLSRNISKRGMENTRYLKATAGLRGKFQKMKNGVPIRHTAIFSVRPAIRQSGCPRARERSVSPARNAGMSLLKERNGT